MERVTLVKRTLDSCQHRRRRGVVAHERRASKLRRWPQTACRTYAVHAHGIGREAAARGTGARDLRGERRRRPSFCPPPPRRQRLIGKRSRPARGAGARPCRFAGTGFRETSSFLRDTELGGSTEWEITAVSGRHLRRHASFRRVTLAEVVALSGRL